MFFYIQTLHYKFIMNYIADIESIKKNIFHFLIDY